MEFAIVYVCAIPARGKKCLVVSCFYNSSMHRTTNILIYGLEGSEQIVFFTSTYVYAQNLCIFKINLNLFEIENRVLIIENFKMVTS